MGLSTPLDPRTALTIGYTHRTYGPLRACRAPSLTANDHLIASAALGDPMSYLDIQGTPLQINLQFAENSGNTAQPPRSSATVPSPFGETSSQASFRATSLRRCSSS